MAKKPVRSFAVAQNSISALYAGRGNVFKLDCRSSGPSQLIGWLDGMPGLCPFHDHHRHGVPTHKFG
jgi:hypothetical protein